MNLSGLISRFYKQGLNASGVPVRLSALSSLAIAQVEPPYTEATRAGRRFHFSVFYIRCSNFSCPL